MISESDRNSVSAQVVDWWTRSAAHNAESSGFVRTNLVPCDIAAVGIERANALAASEIGAEWGRAGDAAISHAHVTTTWSITHEDDVHLSCAGRAVPSAHANRDDLVHGQRDEEARRVHRAARAVIVTSKHRSACVWASTPNFDACVKRSRSRASLEVVVASLCCGECEEDIVEEWGATESARRASHIRGCE